MFIWVSAGGILERAGVFMSLWVKSSPVSPRHRLACGTACVPTVVLTRTLNPVPGTAHLGLAVYGSAR